MMFASPFARNSIGSPMGHGLGTGRGGQMMRRQGQQPLQYGSQHRYQQPGLGGPPSISQPTPSLGQSPSSYTPTSGNLSPQVSPTPQPQQQSPGLGQQDSSVPLDPFGTQASGGQYGNLSGTPAIFGASDYGQFQNQGTLNTSPEAQAILERTKTAAMGNFNQGLNAMGQPTTAGTSGPQMGQTLGDNQWNGTSWVSKYNAPQGQGFYGGSNPGGY